MSGPGLPVVLTEAELRAAVTADGAALAAIERAFAWLHSGRVSMPPVMHVALHDRNGDVDVKSAYVEGLSRFAVKIASGFPGNANKGLPSGSGLMVLLSADTGFCEAVLLDNGYLTDLRTGLAGAVAAKYLAVDEPRTVGVVGTGIQARYQIECLRLVRSFDRLLAWGRSPERLAGYVQEMRTRLGVEVLGAATVEEVVRESQVVITATAAREPLVRAEWLHPGLHITSVGSDLPGKRELESEVLRRADLVVCDRRSQCRVIGELQHLAPGEIDALALHELGELTSGLRPGRNAEDQITVCDLTGTGVQDTAIADLAFRAATGRDRP